MVKSYNRESFEVSKFGRISQRIFKDFTKAVLSPAAERFFALLINLWTDDKDNLWTNIVERQRHALQEIG